MTGAWRVQPTRLDRTTLQWRIVGASGETLRHDAVVAGWAADAAFLSFWRLALREVPFDAYAFECPPVTASSASRPFECVFVSSPALAALPAEPAAFAEHFRPGRDTATFRNLGGDAVLVAPRPDGDFTHLARFAAGATPAQSDAFWRAVGIAMQAQLGERPVWLSTAGLGVGWLHARLDSRPKYYRHEPYARR